MRKLPPVPAMTDQKRAGASVAWTCVGMAGVLLLVLGTQFPAEFPAFAQKGMRTLGGVLAIAGPIALLLIGKAKTPPSR